MSGMNERMRGGRGQDDWRAVTDRATKRLAERVIEDLSGVVDIHNALRVQSQSGTRLAASTATTGEE